MGFFVRVDDFGAAHQQLTAAGVEFLGPPRAERYGQVAVFRDIVGNTWDLLGPGRLRRYRESRGPLRPARPAPRRRDRPEDGRLRREHHRLPGNGWCTRPPQLDCAFESICETCSYFQTGIEFRPVLQAQQDDAITKHQDHRR